jgi:hypothetical protein
MLFIPPFQGRSCHRGDAFPFTYWPSGLYGGGLRAIDLGLWAVPHRDPFDRLLAAQTRSEDFVLASTDAAFTQFEGVVTPGVSLWHQRVPTAQLGPQDGRVPWHPGENSPPQRWVSKSTPFTPP